MAGIIKSYRDLLVWQRAMEMADLVYDLTAKFPSTERFGLARQMRDAAVSVPSNIAEGTRHGTAGYRANAIIALGEHAELETEAIISAKRSFISPENMKRFETLSEEFGRLGHGLSGSLKQRLAREAAERAAKNGRRRNQSPDPNHSNP